MDTERPSDALEDAAPTCPQHLFGEIAGELGDATLNDVYDYARYLTHTAGKTGDDRST